MLEESAEANTTISTLPHSLTPVEEGRAIGLLYISLVVFGKKISGLGEGREGRDTATQRSRRNSACQHTCEKLTRPLWLVAKGCKKVQSEQDSVGYITVWG